MDIPKVLVASPTYEGKAYIEDEYYANIKNLDYPNYQILIVDNSVSTRYTTNLKRKFQIRNGKTINFAHLDRGNGSRDAHTRSYNYIVDYAIKHDFEYCMFIETDLIPPKDIIQQLMSWNKLCVGSVYIIGKEGKANQPVRPCLFKVVPNEGAAGTMPLNMSELKDMLNKGLQPIHGCGFGCTLIKTSLLKKFPMYWEEKERKHCDVLFYKDLHNAGYNVFVDTNRIIPHYNSDWDLVKDY